MAESNAPVNPGPPSPPRLFPIVGIGASAGGLEPLEELLGALLATVEMAILVIVHSDPTHATLLPEILTRRTKFTVIKAEDGAPINAKCVYVCPSDAVLTVAGGKLHLTPRKKTRDHFLPIDQLFCSLASEFENRAVSVVLSGTGCDGTMGTREVKLRGGITFSQTEASAKFHSMPQHAIATGAVDFVVRPKDIALKLEGIAAHEYTQSSLLTVPAALAPTSATGAAEFKNLLTVIRRISGIDFSQYKYGTVSRRILRRMALHNIGNIPEFQRFLTDHPEKANEVAQDILIQVTKFFREPEIFSVLKDKVFPAFVENRTKDEPIRVWVPGCSSGEEVYSLLIALLEFLEEGGYQHPIQFFGTDLSDSAILKARGASYLSSIEQDVSADRLQRFFTKNSAGYEINKALRDVCIFAKHNVVSDPPFGKLDLVTCRNLLIYLETELQQRALSIFHYALKPSGVLLLSSSETVGGVADLYSAMDTHHRLYARKAIGSRLFFDFVGARQTADKISTTTRPAAMEGVSKGIRLQRDADRYLLEEFVPAGVLVNDKLELVQFRGKTGPFFEPSSGFASLDLIAMLKTGLVLEVKKAIELARNSKVSVRREMIPLRINDEVGHVAVEVVPMTIPATGERYFILLFEDMSAPRFRAARRRGKGKGAHVENAAEPVELAALRAELSSTLDSLQVLREETEASNEELRAANEGIVSSNEELQSTNEELHSAKEELQSTNEELLTVNDELKVRNQDLSTLNDDLSNLFNSFNSAMVLLTRDLRIRRFTPLAESLLRLLPGDVGRAFTDIRPSVEIQELDKMLLQVVATGVSNHLEVEDKVGKWYAVQMNPYRTLENRIDGAVLLFTDITELKTSAIYAEAVESIYAYPLLVLRGDLRITRANRKYYEVFKASPRDTENRFIYEVGSQQWNIPELRDLLEKVLPQNSEISDFSVTHDFPNIGRQTMTLSARRLFYQDTATETILLAIKTAEVPV